MLTVALYGLEAQSQLFPPVARIAHVAVFLAFIFMSPVQSHVRIFVTALQDWNDQQEQAKPSHAAYPSL